MFYPMVNQLGNARFNDMLDEAARERRANQVRKAGSERKLFNINLGNLRISVSRGVPANTVARPGLS